MLLFSSADIGARFRPVRNHTSPFPACVVNIINYKPDVKLIWRKTYFAVKESNSEATFPLLPVGVILSDIGNRE